MTVDVFQIDPVETLAPYTYETEAIHRAGGRLIIGDCNTPEDVIAQAGDAEVLLLSWKPVLPPEVMDALPKVRLMIRWGVGYDQIDAAAATLRGIAVANAPKNATEDVAEQAIAMLVNCVRHVSWFDQRMHRGEWSPANANRIQRMTGRTLGLIGIGRIGSAVARRARGLGLRVIAHDTFLQDSDVRAAGCEPRSMDALLAESDYISIHVPLNANTRHLVDAACLARMRPGVILINTSRGPVIDEPALIDALKRGHVGGAGLDVFEQEPLQADSPLRGMEHVVLTPHMAAYSEESRHSLRVEVCDVVTDWIRDGWSSGVVNPAVRANLRRRR